MAKMYRVKWIIDIEADSPLGAAIKALATQRDLESTATFFRVEAHDDSEKRNVELAPRRCKVCGDHVPQSGLREHLEGHHPGAKKLRGKDVEQQFE